MIRIAVCDDDQVFISEIMKPLLSKALNEVKLNSEIICYTSGKTLIKDFSKKGFDIVILDIDMPIINGKELAKELRIIDSKFHLAFMSAYKEEAYQIIQYQVDAFIPKEYDLNKCLDCLKLFLQKYILSSQKVILFNIIEEGLNSIVRLYADDIYYFYNNKNMITLHTDSKKYVLKERTFKQINNTFEDKGFFKIYPNIIVNINKIYEVFDCEVLLINNVRLPISRRKRKEILTRMADVMSANVVI